MLDIFKLYATDPKAELEGRELDFGGGVKLLVARAQNPKYTRMINQQLEAHKHELEQKETEDQIATAEARSNKISAYVMAHSILLGWSGPVMYKGQPLPYSVANAEMILQHKDFQNEVWKKSADFRNYRVQTEEADAKNSPTTSGGSSSGEASSAS